MCTINGTGNIWYVLLYVCFFFSSGPAAIHAHTKKWQMPTLLTKRSIYFIIGRICIHSFIYSFIHSFEAMSFCSTLAINCRRIVREREREKIDIACIQLYYLAIFDIAHLPKKNNGQTRKKESFCLHTFQYTQINSEREFSLQKLEYGHAAAVHCCSLLLLLLRWKQIDELRDTKQFKNQTTSFRFSPRKSRHSFRIYIIFE